MKKFIALAAVVLVSMATTTMYAQESRAEKRADRKAQRDAERARLKAEEQAQDAISVSTQFRASPFERALFSALNRVLLIN